MALASTSAFASFDLTDIVQQRDISPFLSEALLYDFHLLGELNMAFDSPVHEPTYSWIEDSLNADTVVSSISLSSSDASITYTASSQPHVGDYLVSTAGGTNSEVMQITTVNSTTNSSVSRGYNATTAASSATSTTYALIRIEQEMSDIGADFTVNPTVRSNYTSIIPGKDLQISGSELMRDMSASAMQDQVAHQLQNRLKEWKKNFTRAILYSEKVGPGSDTQYRSLGGFRYWIKSSSGQTASTAVPISMSVLNGLNKSIVDQGAYPDLLVIGTDLVDTVNTFEATNRRLLETDTKIGYVATQLLLGQGNSVRVVVDPRVHTGDGFLLCTDRIKARPGRGRALFTLAGQDWVDGKKRRILGEWGLEFRQPSVHGYLSNKS